jgi:hypothetical protein
MEVGVALPDAAIIDVVNFRTPLKGASQRFGKIIEFCTQIKKSA